MVLHEQRFKWRSDGAADAEGVRLQDLALILRTLLPQALRRDWGNSECPHCFPQLGEIGLDTVSLDRLRIGHSTMLLS